MRFISLSTILVCKEYLAKINNRPKHHGAGPPEASGPTQPHSLHRLEAGPVCSEEFVVHSRPLVCLSAEAICATCMQIVLLFDFIA